MKVKIAQQTKTATQSGKGGKDWIITLIENENSKTIDNVMGWTSSGNTATQLKLKFKNKESAIAYAKQNGFDFQVVEPSQSTIHKKSYADNFS